MLRLGRDRSCTESSFCHVTLQWHPARFLKEVKTLPGTHLVQFPWRERDSAQRHLYPGGPSAFHLLGIVWISRFQTPKADEMAHLIKCLQQIHKVIGKANEILAGISHPSVCSEVLLSKPGTAYILGLSEVYRVSKRMEDGVKTQQLASERLQDALREVDLAWNNLLSFLVFAHPVFQMLLLELSAESDIRLSGLNLAPGHVCGICLTEVKQESEVQTGNSDPVIYQGSCYHASCANFWLNCVDSTLPREK
ncbi:synergin gamma-like isoform X2 [Paroedura picta]|uniref:synergin gamma-like isoform X2 n=1 Tax=Paroedura picta TaxID=143630 RepID=UPI0040574A7C